jgi:putative protease
LEQLEAAVRFHGDGGGGHIAMVYSDLARGLDEGEALKISRAANVPIALATTVVLMPGEESRLEAIGQARPNAALVRNLAALRILRRIAPGLPLIADYHMNVASELSAAALLEAGAVRVTACMDLQGDGLFAMLGRLPPQAVEAVIRLHVPMFHTAHCLWAANLSKARDCADCGSRDNRCHASPSLRGEACDGGRNTDMLPANSAGSMAPTGPPCRRQSLRLRDRIGEEHPVLADEAGRTTVFNSRVRSLLPQACRLARAGAGWLRVELLAESPEETSRVLAQVAGGLSQSRLQSQ